MYRVINEYISHVKLSSDSRIIALIKEFLKEQNDILSYDLRKNFNQFIIRINMEEYSVEKAEALFYKFEQSVAYSHSEMHVRFNEGNCVRYRFITSNENKEAFYCDLIFN